MRARALEALKQAFPTEGTIVDVSAQLGWGDILMVDVFVEPDALQGAGRAQTRARIHAAVEGAFPNRRISVRVLDNP